MLPLTFSTYLWAGYQVVCQTIRRRHYKQILQSLFPTATVAVYQVKTGENLEQLDSVPHSSSTLEFEDDFVRLYKLRPVKEVNISSWTCYTSSPVTQDSRESSPENIYVVVETRHLVHKENKGTQPDLKVHVFSLGQPVAWKSSDHFDVLVSCNLSGLIQMVDAFGQNRLHLDEDLKVKGFATIQPSGLPQPVYDRHEEAQALAHEATTVSKSFLTSRCPEYMLQTNPPSFSSKRQQALSDESRKKATKPPNILVYCGADERSFQTYASVKASLSLCVNTDVYIIYHLTHAEMLYAPWIENTALLLLSSCPDLLPAVEHKIDEFVFKHKGSLLSFDTSVESCFAHKVSDTTKDKSQLYTFQLDDQHTVTCLKGNSFYTKRQEGVSEILVPTEDSHSDNDMWKRALIMKINFHNGGVVIISQLVFERDPAHSAVDSSSFIALKSSNTARLAALKHVLTSMGMNVSLRANPDLTPCFLLSQKQDLRRKFLGSVHRKLNKESVLQSQHLNLTFLEKVDVSKQVSPNLLPVITADDSVDKRLLNGFAEKDYWRHLETTRLGQIVLYTDVITSTMHVFDGMLFSLPHGLSPVAIAGRQTGGRGRGGNMWLSPLGCAMFTFPLSFDIDSEMGRRVPFLQHLVSTAVVHGIRTLPGCQDLNLRLKWPNDIYYGKEMKLGGVIVTSTVMGSTVYSTIGCGVNVANSDPTICVNDIIQLSNRSKKSSGDAIPLLSPAGVIARTLTTLESLLAEFENYGHIPFCETYYKYWLHGGIQVSLNLETSEGRGQGEVIGLDEYGFLRVCKSSGETISVQPDGNSFDMLQNLVYCKRR
ncbi:hypothetical protein RRG08_002859 [Elysia crispata]|uniref:BPL/LPL catalytic domain-containing protein n=1 Tax=Elysia crispata TaxID=231223 RepID=A0AAE0XUE2_9GAST|nr:hypothetical protein RRG08_002859 [Elysia crispata]